MAKVVFVLFDLKSSLRDVWIVSLCLCVIPQASHAFQDNDLAELTVTVRLVCVLTSHVIFENVNSDKTFLTEEAFVLQLFRLNFPLQTILVSSVSCGLVLIFLFLQTPLVYGRLYDFSGWLHSQTSCRTLHIGTSNPPLSNLSLKIVGRSCEPLLCASPSWKYECNSHSKVGNKQSERSFS